MQSKSAQLYFFLAFIGIIIIIPYSFSLTSPFYFDDFPNIVANKAIQISSITVDEIKSVFSPYQSSPRRFISNLSFALNFYFSQLNPVGFHFVNITIHILNSFLIFYIFKWYNQRYESILKFNPILTSALATLIWATNPIQTNAVTYVVQRMTSLSTFFCLISFLSYIHAREIHKNSKHSNIFINYHKIFLLLLSFLSWTAGIFSKEIAVTLPVIIIFHELYRGKKEISYQPINYNKPIVRFFLLLTLIITIWFIFIASIDLLNIIQKGYTVRDFSISERLLTQPRVILLYISLFLYPLPSRFQLFYDSYPISENILSPPETLASIIILILGFSFLIWLFKKSYTQLLFTFWILLFLLIESTILPLELVFEHRFYLPSIGLSIIYVSIIFTFFDKINLNKKTATLCIFLLVLTQSIFTYTRNGVWANKILFYTQEYKKNPKSLRSMTNFAIALADTQKPELAIRILNNAINLHPDNIIVLSNLVFISGSPPLNNIKAANYYTNRIINLVKQKKAKPIDNQSLLNISKILFQNNKYNESLLLLNQIKKSSSTPDLLFYIAQCYIKLQNIPKAKSILRNITTDHPSNLEYLYFYALTIHLDGDHKNALKILNDINYKKISNIDLANKLKNLKNTITKETSHVST